MSRRLATLLAWALTAPAAAGAQGLPFHTPSALTTSFEEKGLRTFTTVRSAGNMRAWVTPVVLLPWAPRYDLTTTVAVPFLHKRMTGGGTAVTNTGVGDVTVGVKWAPFIRNRFAGTDRVALILSGRIPTGVTDARGSDGSLLPRPMQTGSGSTGAGVTLVGTSIRDRWGLSAAVGRQWSRGDGEFQAGTLTRYDVALGLRFPGYVESLSTRTLQLYLEWNGTVQDHNRLGGSSLASSGGHTAFLGPALQWVVLPRMLLEASVQFPVITDLNGTQPDPGIRPALGLRHLFF